MDRKILSIFTGTPCTNVFQLEMFDSEKSQLVLLSRPLTTDIDNFFLAQLRDTLFLSIYFIILWRG